MTGANKTPGVYIVEKNAFPNSIVEVATAVPAFIGYTEKHENKGSSLKNIPWRITCMAEFIHFFGGAPHAEYGIDPFPSEDPAIQNAVARDFTIGQHAFQLLNKSARYYLYYSMMLFFKNGGAACYLVSVGDYDQQIEKLALENAFAALLKEPEPTMLVIPDAMSLKEEDCIALQQASLMHCGAQMKNRVALLDVYNGYKVRGTDGDCITQFRDEIGTNCLDFGAAYYPWLNTSIVQLPDLGLSNFADLAGLKNALKAELAQSALSAEKHTSYNAIIENIDSAQADPAQLQQALCVISPLYISILNAMQTKLNLLPPAAAMAGVYTMVDNTRGVWKAPANVSLNAVVTPALNITHDEQEDLNVSSTGKSINAIRLFSGEGTLVWGARTLDGNSLDWRYINVRRTMIMLEQSIRLACMAFVFEPNVATTWVTIKSMLRNFLTGIWKRGGLAGAVPEDAFSIYVGLNETMTPEDILEGIMRITVLVALSRPAEFIEITFQQQMQKSS